MQPAVVFALAAALLLSGCAHAGGHAAPERTAPPRLDNPTSFPLYHGSTVVSVVPVDSRKMLAALKASDPSAQLPRNLRGNEVIAETSASMRDVNAWLDQLRRAPPHGLHQTTGRDGIHAQIGDDHSVLWGTSFASSDGERWVYVFTADARKLRADLGPVLALIDNYDKVPGMLRGPIDDQARKQFGYSVSEMLDPKSPAGAMMTALKRLDAENRRGIMILDETRSR